MTDHEYLAQRVHMLEVVVQNLMGMLIEAQPYLGHQINRMGNEWNKERDALNAKRDATDQAKG